MRLTEPERTVVYDAAERFVEAALRRDDSLFTPGSPIWTSPNLDQLYRDFIQRPDESTDPFLEKLHRQLGDAPDGAIQLASEALYVHFLIAHMSGSTKRAIIGAVLGWMTKPVTVPTDIAGALEHGLASPGTAFHTFRPFQLAFIIEFVRLWKALPAEQRDTALVDPWLFKEILFRVPMPKGAYIQREALLHLVHPDTFDAIVSRDHKQEIASAFGVDDGEADIDRRLLATRSELERERGTPIDWYSPEIEPLWRIRVAESGERAWIFQANPAQYDLTGALETLSNISWLVRRYEREISGGDRVYLWETGPDAGIVAVAEVIGPTANIEESPEEAAFWRDRTTANGPRPRVQLRIVRKLDRRLPRTTILATPDVADLPNLRFAQGTNFRLTPTQDRGLQRLISEMEPAAQPFPRQLDRAFFDVLARHPAPERWVDLPANDQAQISALRTRLGTWADELARDLHRELPLHGQPSAQNPSGRNATKYWATVYPDELDPDNKSYAFQLFYIVSAEWVELGFASGSGASQTVEESLRHQLEANLGAARAGLARLRDEPWLNDLGTSIEAEGYRYRRRWSTRPDDDSAEFAAIGSWVDHAASTEGAAASISRFVHRDDAVSMGLEFYSFLRNELARFSPLLDATYRASPFPVPLPQQLHDLDERLGTSGLDKEAIGRRIADAIGSPPFPYGPGSKEPKPLLSAVSDAFGLQIPHAYSKHRTAWAIVRASGGRSWSHDCVSTGESITRLGHLRLLDAVRHMQPADAPHPGRMIAEIVRNAVASAGLWFEAWQVDDVYLALRTKPFVLLTGLSGTGKTKVGQALQDLLCDVDTRELVAVRPDWTDSRSLLGYHNLLTDRFHATAVTRLLLAAAAEYSHDSTTARPFVLILDEMNLARVEHYFADLLSALETRRLRTDGSIESEPIRLHDAVDGLPDSGDPAQIVPMEVDLAPNVYVLGTVNIDETTHPFSRKLLDRAMTIELFDVNLRMSAGTKVIDVSEEDRAAARRHFSRHGQFIDLTEPDLEGSTSLASLIELNAVLAAHRLHIGYRVRNEVLRFVTGAGDEGLLGLDPSAASLAAFDLAVMQKVLPRLAGSRERLEAPLKALLECMLWPDARAGRRAESLALDPRRLLADLDAIVGDSGLVEGKSGESNGDGSAESTGEGGGLGEATPQRISAAELRLPRSARKIARMLQQLQDEGYTSFFE